MRLMGVGWLVGWQWSGVEIEGKDKPLVSLVVEKVCVRGKHWIVFNDWAVFVMVG